MTDLQKASFQYAQQAVDTDELYDAFVAGAKWQKAQSENQPLSDQEIQLKYRNMLVVLDYLKHQIEEENYEVDQDATNWGMEEGVLISLRQARILFEIMQTLVMDLNTYKVVYSYHPFKIIVIQKEFDKKKGLYLLHFYKAYEEKPFNTVAYFHSEEQSRNFERINEDNIKTILELLKLGDTLTQELEDDE